MQTIPSSYTQGVYVYEQIKRGEQCAVFKRKKPEHTNAEYEVIIIQRKSARQLPSGSMLEAGEYYPSASQWGAYGKTTLNLGRAMHLYDVGERDGRFNAQS